MNSAIFIWCRKQTLQFSTSMATMQPNQLPPNQHFWSIEPPKLPTTNQELDELLASFFREYNDEHPDDASVSVTNPVASNPIIGNVQNHDSTTIINREWSAAVQAMHRKNNHKKDVQNKRSNNFKTNNPNIHKQKDFFRCPWNSLNVTPVKKSYVRRHTSFFYCSLTFCLCVCSKEQLSNKDWGDLICRT